MPTVNTISVVHLRICCEGISNVVFFSHTHTQNTILEVVHMSIYVHYFGRSNDIPGLLCIQTHQTVYINVQVFLYINYTSIKLVKTLPTL